MTTDRIPAKDWRDLDRKLNLPTNDQLADIAIRWNRAKDPEQHRPFIKEDHRYIGLLGERAFARMFRLPMDLRNMKHGNRRANFTLSNGYRVDVVTRRPFGKGKWPELAVPMDTRAKVDVWVLCVWLGEEWEPTFTGWITEDAARRYGRIEQFHKRGVPNYVVDTYLLAPIGGLWPFHRVAHAESVEIGPSWFTERAADLAYLAEVGSTPTPPDSDAPQGPESVQLVLL
jgi:hypothetical protein